MFKNSYLASTLEKKTKIYIIHPCTLSGFIFCIFLKSTKYEFYHNEIGLVKIP